MKRFIRVIAMITLLLIASTAAIFAFCFCMIYIFTGSIRAWRILIGFDQLMNAATGGNEDETISSRAAKARQRGRQWGCVLCRLLDSIDKDHCNKSIEPDKGEAV